MMVRSYCLPCSIHANHDELGRVRRARPLINSRAPPHDPCLRHLNWWWEQDGKEKSTKDVGPSLHQRRELLCKHEVLSEHNSVFNRATDKTLSRLISFLVTAPGHDLDPPDRAHRVRDPDAEEEDIYSTFDRSLGPEATPREGPGFRISAL